MALSKLFNRIFWHNDTEPALNEDNLNSMSKAIDDIDDRIIELGGAVLESVPKLDHIDELVEESEQALANIAQVEQYADNAANSATLSKSWAEGGTNTRAGEDTNNSKFWAEKAEGIYHALGSALHPMGTITFANLPPFEALEEGYMYNISDAFTSDSRFKDGSGVTYDAGANVYAIKEVTTDQNDNEVVTWYWDVMAPTDQNKMNKDGSNSASHVKMNNALSIGNRAPSTIGIGTLTNGVNVEASGAYSHAEGLSTMAQGVCCHAEGQGSIARGENSHAEGRATKAEGINCHAEGSSSEAITNNSLAIGVHGQTKTHSKNENDEINDALFAIGGSKVSVDCNIAKPLNTYQEEESEHNVFVVDEKGNIYMSGAPYKVHGVVVNRLVADGDEIILEDGAEYVLYAHTRITSTGAWRGMQAYAISATFNPIGKSQGMGTTTTAQAIPQVTNLGAAGTVGCNLNRTYEAYENDLGATAYHSKLGIGTCSTNMTCRYSLMKVIGSEEDFVDNYGI